MIKVQVYVISNLLCVFQVTDRGVLLRLAGRAPSNSEYVFCRVYNKQVIDLCKKIIKI